MLDIHAENLFEDVHRALREGLIDSLMVSPREIERAKSVSMVAARQRLELNSHLQPIHDVVAELESWTCFNPKEYGRNPKAGRNDPCLCGSGKKCKKCCVQKP